MFFINAPDFLPRCACGSRPRISIRSLWNRPGIAPWKCEISARSLRIHIGLPEIKSRFTGHRWHLYLRPQSFWSIGLDACGCPAWRISRWAGGAQTIFDTATFCRTRQGTTEKCEQAFVAQWRLYRNVLWRFSLGYKRWQGKCAEEYL